MKYLIHNVYGDCDHLIATAPEGVECVARGWTAEEEAALAQRLAAAELNGVSCLPCLLEWVPQVQRWVETRVADLPLPWTWEAIDAAHASNIATALLPPDPPIG